MSKYVRRLLGSQFSQKMLHKILLYGKIKDNTSAFPAQMLIIRLFQLCQNYVYEESFLKTQDITIYPSVPNEEVYWIPTQKFLGWLY